MQAGRDHTRISDDSEEYGMGRVDDGEYLPLLTVVPQAVCFIQS